ncbi:MAG: hypothetical protein Q7T81_13965 [Pseudolabrys sp.]|nr:hypothetical protein [Pseudolabrys sp.]
MVSASRMIGFVSALCIGGFACGGQALAQSASVALVQQDQSDCTNANVKDNHGEAPGGTIDILRNQDGSTSVKVGLSATPLTTYDFYLKCVRALGVIKTDEDGVGEAVFTIPAGGVGAVFAFDSYPAGAPPGNKFQSVQVQLK